jgi:hypothetical protein
MYLNDVGYGSQYKDGYSDYGYNTGNGTRLATRADYASGRAECQTCKSRKYQDGSDEMVSFKSAAHISPESSAGTVRAHEQEHVSNAFSQASQDDGEVVSVSVSLHTSICPECGRSYISGGTTKTQIKYVNEDNKYQQELKSQDKGRLTGMFFDEAV